MVIFKVYQAGSPIKRSPSIENSFPIKKNIWVTIQLNEYLDFPHVGQAFMVERISYNKKSGKETRVVAHHWSIENSCHYIIDWIFDEDRNRISKGFGPENITRLRRFAVGLFKSKGVNNVTQKMRQLNFSPRKVLDYLKLTGNTQAISRA